MLIIPATTTNRHAYHAPRKNCATSAQCERIVQHIRDRGGDWSIGELAQALEMEKSTVSARVFELLYDRGDLAARPKRKDRVSGVMVRPVALAGGLAEFQ